jgi:hypothetical protein
MLERRKTARGTAWLPVWLFASCLFDASRVRTFSRVPAIESSPLFALAIVGLICKAGMLAAENTSGVPVRLPTALPAASLTSPQRDGTAESRASFLSQLLFLWLWPTIWRGFRAPLQLSDLDDLSFDFKGSLLGRRIASVWQPGTSHGATQRRRSWRPWPSEKTSAPQDFEMDEHEADTPELRSNASIDPPRGLLWVCVLSFPGAVLAPAVPRLIMVAATLAQPYLVSATLTFAESFQEGAVPQSTSNGWGLVGAYALVFTVLAFSTGQYYWLCAKAIVKLRGGLIELLYAKSLKLHVEAAKRSGGGAAANLISVDLERFVKIVDPVHVRVAGLRTRCKADLCSEEPVVQRRHRRSRPLHPLLADRRRVHCHASRNRLQPGADAHRVVVRHEHHRAAGQLERQDGCASEPA